MLVAGRLYNALVPVYLFQDDTTNGLIDSQIGKQCRIDHEFLHICVAKVGAMICDCMVVYIFLSDEQMNFTIIYKKLKENL